MFKLKICFPRNHYTEVLQNFMFFIFLFTPWIPIGVRVLSLKQQTMTGRALAEECFWRLSDDLCIDENLCQSQKVCRYVTYEQTSMRHPGLDATREHCHSWTVKATQHSSLLLLDSCHHPCHCEKFFYLLLCLWDIVQYSKSQVWTSGGPNLRHVHILSL